MPGGSARCPALRSLLPEPPCASWATVWPSAWASAVTPGCRSLLGASVDSAQVARSGGGEASPHGPLLEVADLVVEFRQGRSRLLAANHLSLFVRQGETLGIVGESGSGKSVLCR